MGEYINPENHDNEEDKEKMTYEQYLQGEPKEYSDELPTNFLSEEDSQPNETNVFMIKDFKPNFELMIENYTEAIVRCKNKNEIRNVLNQLLDNGIQCGIKFEQQDTLYEMLDRLELQTQIENGEIQVIEMFDGEED